MADAVVVRRCFYSWMCLCVIVMPDPAGLPQMSVSIQKEYLRVGRIRYLLFALGILFHIPSRIVSVAFADQEIHGVLEGAEDGLKLAAKVGVDLNLLHDVRAVVVIPSFTALARLG